MGIRYTRCRDGSIVLHVPLDDETVARLMNVADMSHAAPEVVAASIIHDVLYDDEQAHASEPDSNVVSLN